MKYLFAIALMLALSAHAQTFPYGTPIRITWGAVTQDIKGGPVTPCCYNLWKSAGLDGSGIRYVAQTKDNFIDFDGLPNTNAWGAGQSNALLPVGTHCFQVVTVTYTNSDASTPPLCISVVAARSPPAAPTGLAAVAKP